MDWRLFATKLETADTLEVTVLNNHAPPLYSAVGASVRPPALLRNPQGEFLTSGGTSAMLGSG